jgi:adenosylcobinamide-GDP ribazoletransferase
LKHFGSRRRFRKVSVTSFNDNGECGMNVPVTPQISRLADDLIVSILFCTRLPLTPPKPIAGKEVARASWALPIAGALVGGAGALVYWFAFRLGLPAALAGALALTATLVATGCLHEDGLADTVDGFGGGKDLAHKLEIMRDSRIGTYGVCALTLSLILRWSAVAAIAHPPTVAMALIAAHASARAPLPIFMRFIPRGRADGLSAQAGPPPLISAAVASLLGLVALIIALGPTTAMVGLLLLIVADVFLGWLSMRQIGGQTGDVIGAVEQINEILVLLTCAALLKI